MGGLKGGDSGLLDWLAEVVVERGRLGEGDLERDWSCLFGFISG